MTPPIHFWRVINFIAGPIHEARRRGSRSISFQDKLGEKIRPAVIIQNDADNARLANTVIAMITGNLRDASQATTISIDPATSDGAGSGLAGPSLIKCHNLATVRQKRVLKQIGHLSNPIMIRVNHALKACLDLP
jgi:mRNA interferase MazF